MENAIPYSTVLEQYPNSWAIPYDIVLATKEWQDFRQYHLKQKGNRCQQCNQEATEHINAIHYRKPSAEEIAENQKEEWYDLTGDGSLMVKLRNAEIAQVQADHPVIIHIHHLYYIYPRAPWEHPPEAIITVCHQCHSHLHATQRIPIYVDATMSQTLQLTPCTRCNGTGFLDQYHYVQNGICFRCHGCKFEEFIPGNQS